MQKTVILIVLKLALLCSGIAAAQEKMTIHGMVQDTLGNGLSSVTVALYSAKDSSLAKMALSMQNGAYEFTGIPAGRYFARFTITGFASFVSEAFTTTGAAYRLPDVFLRGLPKSLQGITISAGRPLIQVKADRIVFNVESSINATGSSALEILQKSPGVQVDNKDQISVKGKQGVSLYVDGKKLPLGSEDLAAYLKAMNSNDMEAIEIIHNPGPKYEADGNAGIINIRLKKNSSLGTNASMALGITQGITPKGNGSFGFNYRVKRLHIFSNLSVNSGRYETEIYAPRMQKDTLYEQRLLQFSRASNLLMKGGMDLFIHPKQTVGLLFTSSSSREDWTSSSSTPIYFTPTGEYQKRLLAGNSVPRRRTNLHSNLNYRYVDTSGKEINLDMDYGSFRGRADSYQPNYYLDRNEEVYDAIITSNNTPTDIAIYTGKLDIALPLWRGKISLGAKYGYVRTNNSSDFYRIWNSDPEKVPENSYQFVYTENVNAFYVSFLRQLGSKWSLHSGLRVEQTGSRGRLTRSDGLEQADQNVTKNYLDFFPSVTLAYTPKENIAWSLLYTRRIDRPVYQNLNPFELKLDELSYVKGNAFLRPQYTDNIELVYNHHNKFTSNLSFSLVKDYASQTTDTLRHYTYAQIKNIASLRVGSLSVSLPLRLSSWWKANLFAWANYQVFKGKILANTVQGRVPGGGANLTNTFTFGNAYSAELSGWYTAPGAMGATWRTKSQGGVDIGVQKQVLAKKGMIKITATDIFRTGRTFRAKNDFGGLLMHIWVSRESQTARISFSYNFGNTKVPTSRQRSTGLENEINRIKTN